MRGDHHEQPSAGQDSGSAAAADRVLVVEVSRDLVAALAPGEMAVFRPVSVAYFEDPARLKSETGDAMLGFGPGEVVMLLTPIVLSVMGEVISYLRSDIARALPRAMANTVEDGVRGVFQKFHGGEARPAPVPGLTRDQLSRVRSIAFEKARQGGMSENRANLLADATVGSLVLAP
jgi:hypothetical protein